MNSELGTRVRAVLFDLYDTLAYLTPAVVSDGRRELARLAGVDPGAWAALWRANAMQRMLGSLGGMEEQIRLMLAQLGATVPSEMIADLAERENRSWERAVNPYPESMSTLRELKRAGYKLGLISNCSCQAGRVVNALGVAELVDTLVFSFRVGLAKPDPKIFLHACRELAVRPEECMFVADGAFGELDAASALGMVTVKIEQPHQSGDYGTSNSFDHRIDSLAEVASILKGLRTESR